MKFTRRPKNRRNEKNVFLGVKAKGRNSWMARVKFCCQALAGCGALLVILLGVWRGSEWLMDRLMFENPKFTIRKVEILGERTIHPKFVWQWSGIKEGQNLLALDLTRVKRDLELVQWIESAGVERMLPDTVRITIREHRPVARVHALKPADGGYRLKRVEFLISSTTHVMSPLPEAYRKYPNADSGYIEKLPDFRGVPVRQLRPGKPLELSELTEAVRLVQSFQESPMFGLVRIQSVRLETDSVLKVKTQQGSEIIFHPGDMERQFNRWRLIHDAGRRQGLGVLSTLDLSITNHIPVTWQKPAPQSGPVIGNPYAPGFMKETNV